MTNLINPKDWPARRPDGQTASPEPDPAPPVKGTGKRPGLERIEARVPTQKARKFKLRCTLLQLKYQDVIEELIDAWLASDAGRPDGQTANDQIRSTDLDEDEENKFITSSSDHLAGRPDGQTTTTEAKRREILAYYVLLTGNPIKPYDQKFLERVIHHPTSKIKIGIALSVARCPAEKPMKFLSYCHGAIEEIVDGPDIGDEYLRHLEKALARMGKLILPSPEQPATQPALPGTSGELIELKDRST